MQLETIPLVARVASGWIAREANPPYAALAVADHFEAFNLETVNGIVATAERLGRLAGTPARPPG